MLVIFDMDGTLVDSSKALVNAINYVRSKLCLKPLDGSIIMDAIVNPHSNMAKQFYELEEIEPIHEEWFKEYYSANHDKELILYDGVEQMLQKLSQSGATLALATNAYRESTIQALKHLKIDSYFDDIICFDDVKNGKPAPDMLYLLMHRNRVPVNKTVFIGDSDRDKLAAKEANIEFLQVDFGQNYKDRINTTQKLLEKILNREVKSV